MAYFLQTVPVEPIRPHAPCAAGNRTEATQYRVPVNEEGEQGDDMALTGKIGGLVLNMKGTVCLPPVRLVRSVAGIMAMISNQTAFHNR